MKFTSEDLMKAMGLSVGDKLLISNEIYIIDETGMLYSDIKMGYYHESFISEVICNEEDYEILPNPKRVGQLTCRENKDCRTCPLWWICFIKINEKNEMETSLYEMLESFAVKDQEVYYLLKKRLDKEVE